MNYLNESLILLYVEIIFGDHAERRLRERGILKEELVDTIRRPDKTIKVHGKHHFQKNIGRGVIEACCEVEKHIYVITVYWL